MLYTKSMIELSHMKESLAAKERLRVNLIAKVAVGELSASSASAELQCSTRQVQRLVSAFKQGGDSALISKKRGRPSNRRYPLARREAILAIVGKLYRDSGPTAAARLLRDEQDIRISKETLRAWMIDAGMWLTRSVRKVQDPSPTGARAGEETFVCTRCGGDIVFRVLSSRVGPVPIHISGPGARDVEE